jgi:hypothetical protein
MAAAAILVVAAVALLGLFLLREPKLVLSDQDSGRVFARLPLADGDSFSVTFRHSVNKSDVTEIYQRRGKEIWLTGCVYYGFGAGVAEELDPSWTLETGENGEMILGNIEHRMDDLTYVVGTVYDHILTVGGERIVLNELAGRNRKVHFSIG